jgi:hypothetical protein
MKHLKLFENFYTPAIPIYKGNPSNDTGYNTYQLNISTDTSEEEAFDIGLKAFNSELTINDNPYIEQQYPNSKLIKAWIDGFHHGQRNNKITEGVGQFNFKTEQDDENTKITATKNKVLAGSITFQSVFGDSGWYWFDGILTEDQYDDLFEGKNYVIIEHIKVYGDKRLGLGTELMTRALDYIQKKTGAKLIVLNASPLGSEITLENLVSFYKKFGFKVFKNQGGNVIMLKRI